MGRSKREEMAAELQANKEDLEGWEIAESEHPKEPAIAISIRIRPDEIDLLQERAAERGTTVSAIIRAAIHRYFDDAATPTVRFTYMGPAIFSSGPPPPFTEAKRYIGEEPAQQIFDLKTA